jgi:hypothetical protein
LDEAKEAAKQDKSNLVKLAEDWWYEAWTLNEPIRAERARDEDYYDGIQWTDAEVAILTERGQAPLVINVCAPVVNWLLGTERRTRIDFKVIPRTNDEDDSATALAKTNLLKYIYTDNYVRSENSMVFKDGVVSGEGWVEVCFSQEDTDNPIEVRNEDWRNIWFDYRSTSRTLDDARYIFRSKVMDEDMAVSLYPENTNLIKSLSTIGNTLFGTADPSSNTLATAYGGAVSVSLQRPMVRMIEGWFRIPEHSDKIVGGTFDGYYDDQIDAAVRELLDLELDEGIADKVSVFTRRVRTAMFVASTDTERPELLLLKEEPSPYKHNKFPFIPFFAYRRKRDNTPYGVIRNALGSQDDLNKRRSKAIHILSTNKVIADADAMTPNGWLDAEDEIPKPDAVIKLDGKKNARFEIDTDTALADSHLRLMREDREDIFLTTGVNSDTVGNGNPYASNKAILTKQDQSTVVTTELFDNYRLFLQQEGELMLSLAEQAYVDEEIVRVKSESGGWTYLTINEEDDSGSVLNDISSTRHDYVLSEEDYRDTLRQSMFEKMMELMGQLPPDTSMAMLDLVVDMSDIPNKKTIVDRIRSISGQEPPADEATPEDKVAAQEREQVRQGEQERANKRADVELRNLEADAARKEADATWKSVKAEHTKENARKTKVEIAARMGILPQ